MWEDIFNEWRSYLGIIDDGTGAYTLLSLFYACGRKKHGKQRTYYQDRYNRNKVWEVAKMNGGYYLRQAERERAADYKEVHPESGHIWV